MSFLKRGLFSLVLGVSLCAGATFAQGIGGDIEIVCPNGTYDCSPDDLCPSVRPFCVPKQGASPHYCICVK